jgi:ADP-ribose pyrophosphatase YjhB (NUDIX family)
MPWSPHVTVAAVIERDGRYLVVEEAPDGVAVLNQPAGHVEFGESLTEAVRREVLEETARQFSPTGLVGIYQWTLPGSDRTYLRFCFRGTVSEPLPEAALDPDITATHWLQRAQIADGPLPPRSPLVLRCIDDADAGLSANLGLLHVLA